MIEYHLGPEDVARVRFARSPMLDLVTAVRLRLFPPRPGHPHASWRPPPPPASLASLLRDPAHIPDELLPDARESATIDDDLDHVPSGLRDDIAAYWTAAISPVEDRLRALYAADIAHRARSLASGGVHALLTGLHPDVVFTGDRLTVRKPVSLNRPGTGDGLVLVPCAFAWPRVLASTTCDCLPTVVYPPRGVATLWTPAAPSDALADLLGRTRAAVLAAVDLPRSTKDLAVQLRVSTATVNEHLWVLHRAGLVARDRDGRRVLYRATDRGRGLVG